MCMLGRSRLALFMELEGGSENLTPSALGRRLMRAMGDHLSVGTTKLDLQVTVGIGIASTEIDPAVLSAAAAASVRATQALGAIQVDGSPVRFIAVTHVPASSTRLFRRVLLPMLKDDDATAEIAFSRDEQVSVNGHTNGSGSPKAREARLLLVDPESSPDCTTHPALEVVAATAKRLGARPTISPAGDADSVLLNLYVTEPDAVVVVLQNDHSRRWANGDLSRSWERAANLTRTLLDAKVPVIALSMGASAAALAACVEQGATGIFDPEALDRELDRVTNDSSRSNGYEEARMPGRLPAPYDTLVHLTPSERRVLCYMMEGRSAVEIASTLVVSVTTVRSHIRSILRKLHVNSQLAAVALAFGTILDEESAG